MLFGILLTIDIELICLAENAYHEAREDSHIGMKAVSQVVLNRYNDINNRWPKTVCGVVYDPSNKNDKPWKCDFSWTCDDKPNVIDDYNSLEISFEVAQDLMINKNLDITYGALYYYRCELHGTRQWMDNIEFTVKIGKHCFYRDK